jgi:cytochrome c biogenesis protein CcdA
LPAAFVLGLIGAVTSGCNLAVVGAAAGLSGSLGSRGSRRPLWIAGLALWLGSILGMLALFAVVGFVGQVWGDTFGSYWKFATGLILVVFGLASLGLLPMRMPKLDLASRIASTGSAGAALSGLALGGVTSSCSVTCNPVLPLALGYATLQGATLWGAASLTAFAVGSGLPLAGGLVGLGVGLQRLRSWADRLTPVIRIVAGVLLIGVGFFLLATL